MNSDIIRLRLAADKLGHALHLQEKQLARTQDTERWGLDVYEFTTADGTPILAPMLTAYVNALAVLSLLESS